MCLEILEMYNFFVDFMVCLLSSKINPRQLAYLANLYLYNAACWVLFNVSLNTIHHMMTLLSKSMAMTSEMSKTKLVLRPDH